MISALSHGQRASFAVLTTMFAVGGLEISHFSRGTSLVLEVGYFLIPAAISAILFQSMRERLVAFALLTAAGLLAAGSAIIFYLTH